MLEVRLDIPHLFDDECWQQCLEDFLLRTYDRSESGGSFRIYKLHLRRFFTDKSRMPDEYTSHEVSVFLHSGNGKDGKPIASATLNQRLAVLRGFYAAATIHPVKRNGKTEPLFIGIPPTASMQHRKPARVYKALSVDEIKRFFQAIEDEMIDSIAKSTRQLGLSFDQEKFSAMSDGHKCGYIKQITAQSKKHRAVLMYYFIVALRDKAMFWLYLTSARRAAEVRGIRWMDVESTMFTEHGISRRGHLFRFRGKGRGMQLDSCELAESAYTLIMNYLTHSGRIETIQDEDYIFAGTTHPRGGGKPTTPKKPMTSGAVCTRFRRYAKRAKVPRTRTLHSFRHASARIRHENGADIRAIQRTLRHSNLATTSDYLDALITVSDPESRLVESQFEHLSGIF